MEIALATGGAGTASPPIPAGDENRNFRRPPLRTRGRKGRHLAMLSHPSPEETRDASELRGIIFTDLDRLAFALEMEASELIEQGREEEARRRQELRLGVRLAQRLVADVHADEVHDRIDRFADAYRERLGGWTDE